VSPTLLAHGSLETLFGISISYAAKRRVIAELEIEPQHLTEEGAVSGSVIMALAEAANTRGAVMNLSPGQGSATIESKIQLLARGRGSTLRAEATPVHLGGGVSIWRAAVLRNDEQIAEVTQTQMVRALDGAAGPSRQEATEPRRRGRGEGPLSEGFSKEVVDERWQRIVEGASKVIAAKGFAKATIREIAASADMPVATMYQYLERKEDILYNIYKHFMSDIVTSLTRWRTSDLPPRERLAGAIRMVIDVFDEKHRFIKLMFQETKSLTPEARREVYGLDAQYIAVFRDLLSELMRAGEVRVRNVELTANFVYFLCTIWPLRYWSIGKYGEQAVADDIIDFVLNGLGDGKGRGGESLVHGGRRMENHQ
jgi:TetR/AcrR family transcriptional regulator, cholesterol catabolism regulator